MKTFAILLALGAAFGAGVLFARPLQEDWMQASKPGESHRRLTDLAGTWKGVARTPGEGDKWTESPATLELRSILGGRFLLEQASCELFGETLEWVGLYGFDAEQGRYVATWCDNFGTGFDTAEGEWDASRGAIVLRGEKVEPPGDDKVPYAWILTPEGPKKLRVAMTSGDGEQVELEVVCERK
jgi:hypothetical protein